MGLKVAILTSGVPADVERAAREGTPLDEEARRLLAPAQWLHDALSDAGHDVAPLHLSRTNGFEALSTLRGFHADVVWPLSCAPSGHATGSFDGSVQDVLFLMGLPFVGSPAIVRRSLADRGYVAAALERASFEGDAVAAVAPRAVSLGADAVDMLRASELLDLVEQVIPGGFPLCVKPQVAGCGMSPRRVSTPEALSRALQDVFASLDAPNQTALVQEWAEGAEVIVPVLGDADDVLALPPVEIVRDAPADTRYVAPVRPASLSPREQDAQAARSELERAAVDAYLAAGCRDLGNVRLIWDGGRALVLGVDPAPSLAEDAPLAIAARAADIDLATIVDQLVAIAAERGR